MARSCGIRIGSRRVELLVLDGSAKRPKLVGYHVDTLEADEEGGSPLENAHEALRQMGKGLADKVSSDTTGLVLDSGAAVYRHLSLPFADKAKIEEVLKFEVESKIPQWDIDDTLCDFHVISATPVESHLLVSAVPKGVLEERLDVCRRAGLEPLDAELDASALFTAAEFAGVLTPDSAQLLIYIGDGSATLVVVSNGALMTTRAFHFDLEPLAPKVAKAAADGEEPGDAAFERSDDEDLLGQREARRRVHLTRLRREIARTLSSVSTENGFDAIWLCGVRIEELLSEPIGDVEVKALDPLAEVAGAEDLEDRLAAVVAFGAALRHLGFESAVTPNLRREELAFAGTFERLELPLGVLGLLLIFFLAAQFLIQREGLELEVKKLDHWAMETKRFTVGEDPRAGKTSTAALKSPPQPVLDYALRMAEGDQGDPERSRFEELQRLGELISGEVTELQRTLGAAEDASYPQSALWAATLTLKVIEDLSKAGRIPRFAVRSLDAQYQTGTSRSPDKCKVTLDLTIWGETAVQSSQGWDALISEIKNQPWLVDEDEIREPARNTGEDGTSLILDGLTIYVDPSGSEDYFADYEVPATEGN
jgi:Tfp pilus assembly PilM family ATPase